MDRDLKIQDIACIVAFGAIGLAALGGVLFAGAKHQIVMVVICAGMVAAAIGDIRREERKAKRRQTVKQ